MSYFEQVDWNPTPAKEEMLPVVFYERIHSLLKDAVLEKIVEIAEIGHWGDVFKRTSNVPERYSKEVRLALLRTLSDRNISVEVKDGKIYIGKGEEQ